jgi:hypothetical protein
VRDNDRLYVSPSRTYVITVNRTREVGDQFVYLGHRFVKFQLPELHPWSNPDSPMPLDNNAVLAAWYYLNFLDYLSYVGAVFTAEDFADVSESRAA